MTDFDPMHLYDLLKAHTRNIDALHYLSQTIPDNDDISPLIGILSNSLIQSMGNLEVAYLKLISASHAV